ncbi:NADH:ubiquinone oxidoreductase [Clostridium sulfidigenes]|uniref:NADH:ubiquinone oxidoreductase n=1 Tax=Clostridium sulfidigenes TaxID=318464 RepID=A0A084JAC2_9CLOT|nr:NADH-dependent [FeFe] hydrogenase, group A6 [Clostridium sulfidigenes]KEZ85906.1 NADH:ubiquinone oxidoreductase [Clostridium sulfidigenes]HBA05245.1 NADH:ubiquinone oxidoreductase [Clostridium sp.]HCO73742.1 NADH:ubiquinone oxidoreductase [Clostridium sp.]
MSLVTLKINNKEISVEQGTTILDAARKLNIKIPTLCYLNLHDKKTTNKPGSCRVCVVEVEGRKNLAPSCCTAVAPGMVVNTSTPRVIAARKTIIELLLSDHSMDCLTCQKNLNCELQELASTYGVTNLKYTGSKSVAVKELKNPSIVRDTSKCILCRRCEAVCSQVQKVGAIGPINRGFNTTISTAFFEELNNSACTLCGQCINVCPTGALMEKDNTIDVLNAIGNKDKFVVVQTAPAVRAALGEEFGIKEGAVTGKMVEALRELGFDKVYDTDFAADLTIMEEATEFLGRYKSGENLPMITSCCPGWINFIEKHYGNLLNLPSTCKSPQQMWGAIAKTYLAEKLGIPSEKLYVVSVMPCVAKKSEANREEFVNENNNPDIDVVITTRELAKMIKRSGLEFASLPSSDFDTIMGESTGAGVIFGTSGGVMEAALRTAYEWITNSTLEELDFKSVRGLEGIKEASLVIDGNKINIAIVNGLANAKNLLDNIEDTSKKYHFIEVMACPGGCINGGGQPYSNEQYSLIEKRMNALYSEDANKVIRKSHENPEIIKLYDEFLGKPNGEKSHHLLHTHYINR